MVFWPTEMEAVQTKEALQNLGLSAEQGCEPAAAAASSVILLLKATEPDSSKGIRMAFCSFSIALQSDRLD